MPSREADSGKAAIRRSAAILKRTNKQPDAKTSQEEEDLDEQHKRAALVGVQQDIAERKRYANLFFRLTCIWLCFVAALFICQGDGSIFGKPFHLNDNLLLALVGASTIKIIGVLYVVANYLFPRK